MFDFRYELEDAGWAMSRFHWEGGKFEFRTEYTNDPIAHLAAQARWFVDSEWRPYTELPEAHFSNSPRNLRLVVEESSFKFPWTDEPWEDIRKETLKLTLHHKMDFDLDKDNPPVPLPLGEILAGDYVQIIFRELSGLWEMYGFAGYRDNWLLHDFPLADFIMVGQLLDAPSPARRFWE